jgi:hypothetical protein
LRGRAERANDLMQQCNNDSIDLISNISDRTSDITTCLRPVSDGQGQRERENRGILNMKKIALTINSVKKIQDESKQRAESREKALRP